MKKYMILISVFWFILFVPFLISSQNENTTQVDIIQYLKDTYLNKPVVTKVDTMIINGGGKGIFHIEENPTEYHQDSNSVLFVYYSGLWPLGKWQYTDSADAYVNFTNKTMEEDRKEATKVPMGATGVITEVVYRNKKKQKNIFRLRFVPDKWKGTYVKPEIAFFLEKAINEYSPSEIDNFVRVVFATISENEASQVSGTSDQTKTDSVSNDKKIEIGMTIEQVKNNLGNPNTIIEQDESTVVYIFDQFKVIFKNGVVSAIDY